MRRANGEISVFKRKDGRWAAQVKAPGGGGKKRYLTTYGRTRLEALHKLEKIKGEAAIGIDVVNSQAKLTGYLDYWLENYIKPNRRPATWEQYEMLSRRYLKPFLGGQQLRNLSVPMLQTHYNELLAAGHSVRTVEATNAVLRSALTCAMREELLMRNVAGLVQLPQNERKKIEPWTAEEVRRFLEDTKTHRHHAAYILCSIYGMRRGEVLGLRWRDVDFDNQQLHIRQSLQSLKHGGGLRIGPLKTKASRRNLPLLRVASTAMRVHYQQQVLARTARGEAWCGTGDAEELVFTTSTGRPIGPDDFSKMFKRQCETSGLRSIKLHHLRHTAATMMKNQGVPARDAQFILGHATSWVTQQIYTHDDMPTRAANLAKIEAVAVPIREESVSLMDGVPVSSRTQS